MRKTGERLDSNTVAQEANIVGKFWAVFFTLTSVIIFAVSWISPAMHWWFPGDGNAYSTLGGKIDDLFYLILVIVSVTFVGTSAALGYALWKGASIKENEKVWFSHGSHSLEVIWTIVPSAVLLFIALYQLDVWAEYRMKGFAKEKDGTPKQLTVVAEVTAQSVWMADPVSRQRQTAQANSSAGRHLLGQRTACSDWRIGFDHVAHR